MKKWQRTLCKDTPIGVPFNFSGATPRTIRCLHKHIHALHKGRGR